MSPRKMILPVYGETNHTAVSPHGEQVLTHWKKLERSSNAGDLYHRVFMTVLLSVYPLTFLLEGAPLLSILFILGVICYKVRKKVLLTRARSDLELAIKTDHIVLRRIPPELQSYWEQTVAPRTEEFKQLGRIAPSWGRALADNPSVLGDCIPLLKYLEGNNSHEVKRQCSEQIWQEMYFLCCRYLDDFREIAAEEEERRQLDREANDEGARRYLGELNGS